MILNDLEKAGFLQFFKDQCALFNKDSSWQIARITHVYRDLFIALNELGDEISLKIKTGEKKGIKKLDFLPVVGDFVFYKENPLANFSYIEKVFQRMNVLERVSDGEVQAMAANIDFALVCSSLNDNFNLNRIERYLALLRPCSIKPVIVLTKTDIATIDVNSACDSIKARFTEDVAIFCVGMSDENSLKNLEEYLGFNKTIILLGSSGVGKSTLTNYFVGSDVQKVNEIRDDDSKGRHTTVSRSMHFVSFGAVIDTPGMRGIAVNLTTNDVKDVFEEITQIAASCRFSNCTHQNEPGCMINEKLDNGELAQERYLNYKRMLKEAAYLERKSDLSTYLAAKKEWKRMSRINKS